MSSSGTVGSRNAADGTATPDPRRWLILVVIAEARASE